MSEPTSIPTRRVLIVDDNEIDRETCRRYLESSLTCSYEFTQYNSVEGALDRVEEVRPSCILLDYHLHDGNGVEFLRSLASIGGTRTYPVVMLTGTGNESIAVDAMKAGAQDYLIKGQFNPEILQRTVDAAIYKAETERLLEYQRVEMERLFVEAQEANARKDQFLAALSHELRTPLTPVLAAVSAIDVDTADRAELRDVFAIIRRNIELEARLIDDMLDLARIASGKLEITSRLVDLHLILTHAAETCAKEIAEKNLSLHWELKATHHASRADSARLQQVFWNLLKNAVKFTPKGGAITVGTRDLPYSQIEITVSDTGIGLEPSMVNRIFDAFEQGDPRVTRQFGGLGLGLAISKALIEAHHGSIQAANHPDRPGAVFTIALQGELPVAHEAPDPVSEIAASPDDHAPFSILLVEDHADSAALLSRFLQLYGYQAFTASSVREAVEIYQRESIDGVVSDIGLPDGSGIDLMEKLQAIRPVPGIALSGFGMEDDLQRSKAAGFLLHLTKPVDWPKLEEALKRLRAADGQSA